jgi:polysaccharide deacetylase family protein (PEP-CTERM system associated)
MKILSFDVEDWFHILDHPETSKPASWEKMPSRLEEGVDRILLLLSDNRQSATFFCLGWVAERFPWVVHKIVSEGHHIASHSYSHQIAFEQSEKEFDEDLKRSIDTLQQVSGKKIDTYRAPGFSITKDNLWVFERLGDAGIVYDCSVFAARRAHGGLSEFNITSPTVIHRGGVEIREFPLNTVNFFGRDVVYSGGGYFRLFPLWYLQHRLTRDNYVMTYFHPRDFDPEQPMVAGLGAVRRFKSYVGLAGSYKKLESVLRAHRFMDITEAAGHVAWREIQKIVLD